MVNEPAAAADVEAHIVALGRHAVDVLGGDPHQARQVRSPEFFEPLRGLAGCRLAGCGAGDRRGRGRARAEAGPARPASSDSRPPRPRTRRPRTGRKRSRTRPPARGPARPAPARPRCRPGQAWRCRAAARRDASASVRLIAQSPSLAVPTSCAPSARASSSCSRSAASGSSSAIRTRSRSCSAIGFDRHGERDLVAAARHRPEAAARPASEPRLEPLADVGEAEAGALVGGCRKLVLAAILQPVADLQRPSGCSSTCRASIRITTALRLFDTPYLIAFSTIG